MFGFRSELVRGIMMSVKYLAARAPLAELGDGPRGTYICGMRPYMVFLGPGVAYLSSFADPVIPETHEACVGIKTISRTCIERTASVRIPDSFENVSGTKRGFC